MSDRLEFHGVLTPAYGRDYSSKREALTDLNSNKDFYAHMLTRLELINLEQIAIGSVFNVRYYRNERLMRVKVNKAGKALEVR